MACVVKLKPAGRSPYWFACFTDANGRRLKKSTRLTRKSKALAIAQQLQKASDEAREGVLTEARTRELLSEILKSVNGQTLRLFSVKEWFQHFVNQKKQSQADKTAMRHEQVMDMFVEFLGPKANLNIATITSKEISDFRATRQAEGLAPATVNLDITMLSAAFNAAWKQGHISFNPCNRHAIPKLKDKTKKDKAHRKGTFTPNQVAALVKIAEGDWRGLIIVAFYTGMRLGDAANLRWSNIDFTKHTIMFTSRKTEAEIETVMHPTLEDYLLSLPTPKSHQDFIFPSLADRNISPLSKAFRKLMEAAKIEQRVIRSRAANSHGRSVNALSFHSFRHTFTSILANAEVSEERRMALTGHSTRDVHQGYTTHELEQLRKAISFLPTIETAAY